MNIKEKEREVYNLENVNLSQGQEQKEIAKKKRKSNISFPKINWYLLIKVWNSLFFLLLLSNPYLVGFYARWTLEQFKSGWVHQPTCFNSSPSIVGAGEDNFLHLKTTCAPSGE